MWVRSLVRRPLSRPLVTTQTPGGQTKGGGCGSSPPHRPGPSEHQKRVWLFMVGPPRSHPPASGQECRAQGGPGVACAWPQRFFSADPEERPHPTPLTVSPGLPPLTAELGPQNNPPHWSQPAPGPPLAWPPTGRCPVPYAASARS